MGVRGYLSVFLGFATAAAGPFAHAQDSSSDSSSDVDPSKTETAKQPRVFSVPFVSADRVLGDVILEVDGRDTVSVIGPSLRRELNDLLNEAGQLALDQAIGNEPFIVPSDLNAIGFDLEIDRNQSQLTLNSVNPEFLPGQTLGQPPTSQTEALNARTQTNRPGDFDRETQSDAPPPDMSANGDTRLETTSPASSSNQDPPKTERAKQALVFSVPLVFSDRVFGDVIIEVGDRGTISVIGPSLRSELSDLLNETGQAALDQAIGDEPFIIPSDLKAAGFDLEFDSGQLELTLNSIRPDFLPVRTLGRAPPSQNRVELTTTEPESFSTFMNVTGNFDYDTRSSDDPPDFFLDGATRLGGIVVEYEAALTDQLSDNYDLLRRSTRAVYDDPESYRRYTAGDLRLNSLSILRAPLLAGFAVEKRRNIFDPLSSVTRLAGRQIFLDNRSTVDVVINGEQYDSFQLDAGTYDLASLPVQQGSNDIQLRVRDSFGRQEIIDYNFFSESLDLAAGDEEYSFAIGVIAEALGFEPSYGEDIASSGFYRRAFSSDLILGGAFQASEDVQLVAATVSVVPQVIPGVFDMESAISNSSSDTGIAARAGYRFQRNLQSGRASQYSFNVDYQSAAFNTIDAVLPTESEILSMNATYSTSLNDRSFLAIGGNYFRRAGQTTDDYSAFTEINYRVSNRTGVTFGAEYGRSSQFGNMAGIRVGLTTALGPRRRASVDYRSRSESFRANISRGANTEAGSFGYDIGVSQFGDDAEADLQLEYNANRFTSRTNINSSGESSGDLFDDQRIRAQIGTSIAYAGGSIGIGRPIANSFLLAKPHPALEGKGVISARTLSRGDYYAKSGLLGAAVQGNLSPYSKQNVQFDAQDPFDAFDVGDGTVLVNPPYKSGYLTVVGTENYISAIGTIADNQGAIALATGRVIAIDQDDDFEELPFFTNSRGRFGLFGLAPGKSYKVLLSGSNREFTITIPKDSSAVLRMDPIMLPDEE